MQLVITPGGAVRCIYGENLDLATLGDPAITRASHVEPDKWGGWRADLAPMKGPVLGPFLQRSQALAAEYEWLTSHWLVPAS